MMRLNPDKCEVLTVTNKHNPIQHNYTVHGQSIKNVKKNSKYLGLSIDGKLNWNSHIDMIFKKANAARAFLQRNTKISRDIKDKCYTTYFRPIEECASSVWDPNTHKYINKLEAVRPAERRSLCFFFLTTREKAVLHPCNCV